MAHSDSQVPATGLVRRRLLQGMLTGTVLGATDSLCAGRVTAAEIPTATLPSSNSKSGGFSTSRFKELTQGMAAYIDRGEIAGFTTLIQRHGEIAHMDVVGWQDPNPSLPSPP